MEKLSLSLTNFQTHVKTLFEVDSNLVCIVGPNSVGKTSLMRAVTLILEDIKGDSYIRDSETRSEVCLKIAGNEVRRSKGEKENRYVINGEVHDSVGFGPIKEAVSVLNLLPLKIDKDYEVNLNLADQLSPHFLIFESDSNKAKFLGALTGSNKIDAALRETNLTISEVKRDIKSFKESKERTEAELKQYDSLESQEDALRKAEDTLQEFSRISDLKMRLENCKKELDKIQTRRLNVEEWATFLQAYIESLKETDSYIDTLKIMKDYREIRDRAVDIRKKQSETVISLNEIRNLYIDSLKRENVCPICLTPITEETLNKCIEEI